MCGKSRDGNDPDGILIPQIPLCPRQTDSYMFSLHMKRISLSAYSNVGWISALCLVKLF